MTDKVYRDAVSGEYVTEEYATANPDTTVSEEITFSDSDKEALEALGVTPGEEPTFHPILKVWKEVLAPAAAEATTRPTPAWCNKVVTSYAGITFADMYTYRDLFFGKLNQLAEILQHEIDGDQECLSYTTPAEDLEHNSKHYKQLLIEWQLAVLQWELDWDCASPDAAPDLAAISEVHKLFFGPVGITAYLDNIQFEFPDADQAELSDALQALRDKAVNGE